MTGVLPAPHPGLEGGPILLDYNATTPFPGRVHVNGHPSHRLPNTVNLSITGVDGAHLLAAVPDVAASTGSACHTDPRQPSPALSAATRYHARPTRADAVTGAGGRGPGRPA